MEKFLEKAAKYFPVDGNVVKLGVAELRAVDGMLYLFRGDTCLLTSSLAFAQFEHSVRNCICRVLPAVNARSICKLFEDE